MILDTSSFASDHFAHTPIEWSHVTGKYFLVEYNSYIGQAIAVQALDSLI